MSAATEREFARCVVEILAIADGKEEVFGRVLDLTDSQVVALIREAATKAGLS